MFEVGWGVDEEWFLCRALLLRNLVGFYSLFLENVDSFKKNCRVPLQQKIKDQRRIVRWSVKQELLQRLAFMFLG